MPKVNDQMKARIKKIEKPEIARRDNYFIKSSGDWVENLSAAIVLQAVNDFRKCAEIYHAGVDRVRMKYEMNRILNFIESEWYSLLTTIPSRTLIKQLMKEFNEMKPKSKSSGGDIVSK